MIISLSATTFEEFDYLNTLLVIQALTVPSAQTLASPSLVRANLHVTLRDFSELCHF